MSIEVENEEDINFSELSEPGTAVKIDGDLYISITPQGRRNRSIRAEDVSVFGDLDISARGFEFSEDTPVRIFDTSNEGDVVYSLFNNQTNLQFYTADENEKDEVLRGVPEYESRGVLFVAAPEPEVDDITGVSPVYRLFNESTGVHLYTVDENEKNYVVENLPNYRLEGNEGVAFYGYEAQIEGTVPLYRFYNQSLNAHFYTPSAEERAEFIASPDFRPEGDNDGIAFYVNPAPEGEL